MAVEATPTQIFYFYYTRVMDVISQENPNGIQDVGSLLKQFPGKEYQVYVQICRKCAVQPEKKPTPEELAKGPIGKVSSWLIEKGFQFYAERLEFMTLSWETFLSVSTEQQLIELGMDPQYSLTLLRAILLEVTETAKKVPLPISKPDREVPPSKPNEPERKLDFEVGESCFTRVLKISDKDGEERWVTARITNVNGENNTFDIFVYNAKAHGVPPEAVNVPRSFLKKSSDHIQVAVPEPRNSDVPQYNTGDRVRVIGLKTHTLYNGLCGTILLNMAKNRRYQVRLDTGDIFAIRKRNISSEIVEVPKPAVEVATRKIRNAGIVGQANDDALMELMEKLYLRNPIMDHNKFGEFAAGYFIAKQKIMSDQDK